METLEAIRTRRSIRKFKTDDVPDELIDQILTAGIWAPSGMNNQPWRFAVIRDTKLKSDLSMLTAHGKLIETAPVLIPVFLDHHASYDMIKDAQCMGACMQNILLAAHSLGLAGLWIGEIRKNLDQVRVVCGAPESYELMAVIVVGHGSEKPGKGSRKGLDKLVFLRQ